MSTKAPVEVLPPETPIPHGVGPQPLPRPHFLGKRLLLAFTIAALADGLSVFFDAHAAGAVGGRFGDGSFAFRDAMLAMDLAARPYHGSDPRPLCLSVLGARGGGGGHVGDRAAKTGRTNEK